MGSGSPSSSNSFAHCTSVNRAAPSPSLHCSSVLLAESEVDITTGPPHRSKATIKMETFPHFLFFKSSKREEPSQKWQGFSIQ